MPRELDEELALDRQPVRLLAVDWAPSDNEGDKLLFLFDCGELGEDESRIQLDNQELDRWEWVELSSIGDYVIDRTARRITAVAAGNGQYLEHGLLPADSS